VGVCYFFHSLAHASFGKAARQLMTDPELEFRLWVRQHKFHLNGKPVLSCIMIIVIVMHLQLHQVGPLTTMATAMWAAQ